MNCLLIFDHLNDIIHMKYNEAFADHMNDYAVEHELLPEGSCEKQIDPNIIVQTFSPIVTSHRIMSCQFGNTYSSIKCENELVIHFEEYMGFLFVTICKEKEEFMKRFTNISVTIARYLCGPDVYQLKSDREKSLLANKLIESWTRLISHDQSMYIEAVEQLFISPELSATTLGILKVSLEKISNHAEFKNVHALILVQNKLLSLYSSQSAKELSSSDILFVTMLCGTLERTEDDSTSSSKLFFSYQILLSGPGGTPKCLPHFIHVTSLSEGVHLVYLVENGNTAMAASLYECFCHLHILQQVQMRREKRSLQHEYENLNLANKKLNDSLKKTKNVAIDLCHKRLIKKWDTIRKKHQEYLRSGSEEVLLRVETLSLGYLGNLKELLRLATICDSVLNSGVEYLSNAALEVRKKLKSFEDFFRVKSTKNFSLGSRYSLTINKYLEEFPGLVHFLYVDRNTNRLTTPSLDLDTREGQTLTFSKRKIWYMIDVAKNKLQHGVMQFIWKDTAFSYAYFLWFEDVNGKGIKPEVFPDEFSCWPGILNEDFYQKLRKVCFPKTSPSKIRCYEVLCIHLGLTNASLVIEQTKKLAATISELRGYPAHAFDLF